MPAWRRGTVWLRRFSRSEGSLRARVPLDGPQGFLAAMDASISSSITQWSISVYDWEILTTGIAVKLYPSCAATHPALDALLDLEREEGLTPRTSSLWRSKSTR